MLQPSKRSETDELRPYLRAAHVQPHGAVDWQVEQKEMWFSRAERDALDLRRGDVVVVEGGAGFGRAAHVGEDIEGWGFQNSIVRVRAGSQSKGRFIAYALRSALASGAIEVATSTATIPHFTAEKVGRFRIPAPPPEEQRRIADYLDRETAEIDAMDADLDRLVRTLLERRGVAQTLVTFSLGDSAAHRSTPDSLLTGIPDDWEISKFGIDFTESTERNGDDPPGPLLSISEYRGVELNERTDGQQASGDVSNYRVVRPDQLAANMMWLNHGGLGVSSLTGYISPDYRAFWISERFDPKYVHYLFRSSRYVDYFEAIGTGVRPNAKRVTKTALNMTPVPRPPLDEQRRIVSELDDQTARIDDMVADANRLKGLLAERRSTLITEVVTGVKEVPV